MVKGKNRLLTDALREVWNTRSRFFSIFLLAALSVAFLAGLRTTSPNMKYTADLYFDQHNLMDGRVLSTLGLTKEDLEVLAAQPGMEAVEGGQMVDVVCGERILSVQSLPEQINRLALTGGRLPQSADECVVERSFLEEAGLELGDTLTLDLVASDAEDVLKRASYTVVGTVDSPMYIYVDRGSSTLGTGKVSAILYILPENFTAEHFSVAYFTVAGMSELDSYGTDYEEKMDSFLAGLEGFADQRAALRYEEVVGEAQDELDKARMEYEKAEAEAEVELANAAQELADSRKELDIGWSEYDDGRRELDQETAGARRELRDALERLQAGEQEYHDGLLQYEQAVKDLEAGEKSLEEQRGPLEEQQALLDGQWADLKEQQTALDEGWAQYEMALSQFPEGSPQYQALVAQLAGQKAQLEEGQAQLEEGRKLLEETQVQLDGGKAQLAEAQAQLEQGRQALDATKVRMDEALAELDQGWAAYHEGQGVLSSAIVQGNERLAAAHAELTDGEAQYADGLAEYEEGKAEVERELANARQELDNAQREIDDIEECQWYVLGRNTLAGYVTYGSDSERMSNLANVFPLIFFLVAALACLTTMTRMVEEQRTQIGCMKALGFTLAAISTKYIGYAFAASFLGGVVGAVLGCLGIPWIIYNAWGITYTLPELSYLFQPEICILAILAAVACTTGASLAACLSTLTATPADLMRPKAPKAGRRVLLERVSPLWKRMKFIQKVTVRNLFRYKQRFWMTVVGIGGCTALIVTGFGLHSSIFDILAKQYDEISPYSASVGLKDDVTEEELSTITAYLDGKKGVSGYLTSYQSTVDVSSEEGVMEGVNLFAVEDMDTFSHYITLRHRSDGAPVALPEEGVVITEKLSELLEVSVGDSIVIDGEKRITVPVGDIVENYVYHYIYLSETYYEAIFGGHPVHNTLMIRYTEDSDVLSDAVSTGLMKLEGVSSYTHIAFIRDSFTDSMASINYAVVIIILAAAALAFVVLYNLTNINITERRRELATLKVLGFYDKEVSSYVYRENIFLTVFGIALGLIMGYGLHAWLVLTVEVNMVMFARTAAPSSYLWAALLTLIFSLIVNVVAHHSLKKIDMVESLKTVE